MDDMTTALQALDEWSMPPAEWQRLVEDQNAALARVLVPERQADGTTVMRDTRTGVAYSTSTGRKVEV